MPALHGEVLLETQSNKQHEGEVRSDIKSVVMQRLRDVDEELSRIVHSLQLGWGDYFVAPFTMCCSSYGIPLWLGVTLFWKGLACSWIAYLFSVLCGLTVTLTVKKVTRRPRPVLVHHRKLGQLRKTESNFSFPSGDSLQAAVFSSFLASVLNSSLPFLLVPLVMFGRVYYVFHYIGDTAAGAAMGYVMAHVCNHCSRIAREYKSST
eukprot:gnl/MRDRNA2_/MRDRNA2_106233_c0_seq1.p1 gnl/MRDRNA2_/MRDRNA2_106233_c0~~gnl/MRDRNA2_/MRDRNA2_106233_c0_seq1.p1  ORF type:complete len:207 (+),score=13.39 gnl/MRDRNA2_/MRDRNA2_106233_c0_seq1:86-706(+)